eukprot:g19395.t2
MAAAAAAAAQRDGGDGPPAEVAAYLFVRLAPHPPSWYLRQQRPWTAPFAYGGAAAQQAMAVAAAAPAEGYRLHHRWASMAGFGPGPRVHVSILLVSFCPLLLLYLLLAFQRATTTPRGGGGGSAAPEGPVTIAVAGGDEPAGAREPFSPTAAPPRGWWAVHWHALFSEDGIQVAISSWSAAASGNAFHSPGTARSLVLGRRGQGEGYGADPEEAGEVKQVEDVFEAEEADPTCDWDGWDGSDAWARMTRVSDAWQEWYSESSAGEPDKVGKIEVSRDRWTWRVTPGSAVSEPDHRILGSSSSRSSSGGGGTTTPAEDAMETSSTSACKAAASNGSGRGGSSIGSCDRHLGGEAGGRQGTTPGADRGGGKPKGGRGKKEGSASRRRRRDGGGGRAAKSNAAGGAEAEIPQRQEGAVGELCTEPTTSHRSRRTTSEAGSRGGGVGQGGGGEEEEIGAHTPRWSGRVRRTRVSATAAGGANQEVVATGGEGQEVPSGRRNHRGANGGAGRETGGGRASSKEPSGSESDSRTSRTRRRIADDRGAGGGGVPATEEAGAVEGGAGAVYRLPYGL